jgi:hypothetical protein
MKLKIYLILINILIISSIIGQDVVETTVRENVVFYTDRDLYLSGEDIWFKAFISVINASESQQLSNVFYIELYQNKRAVVKKKFQIIDGKVEGMLNIPEEIHSANYYIRAYTQYQRNFAPETFFTTLLTIINPEIPVQKSKTGPVKLIEIIPEGGQLFAGLPSKIALKLNTDLVKIVDESLLVNQYGDKVKAFQIAANGLALIEFTTIDTLEYFLKFNLNTGDTVTEPLPKVSSKGIIISKNSLNDELHIYSSQAYRLSNNRAHKLMVYSMEGRKKLELSIDVQKANQSLVFDTRKLESGLYSIVLKNDEGKMAAFTTFYIPTVHETVKLSTQKDVFGRREAVQLTISSEFGEIDKSSSLIVAVVKKGTVGGTGVSLPASIIENPLLLPAFANQSKVTDSVTERQIKAALILNRDFFNRQIIGYKSGNGNLEKTEWLPETRDVSLSGIVRNAKSKQPLSNVWVYAAVLGSEAQFHAYKSKEDGMFIFSLNHLSNTHQLSISMDSIPGVETEFLIYNDFSDNWPVANDIPLQIDSSRRMLLSSMFVNQQVSEMFQQKEKREERLRDSLPFPFIDLQASVYMKDFVALPTMPEVLNELIPYVNVRKRKGKHVLSVVNPSRKNVYDHPLILVDNLPVFNVEEILAINPAKVERIDVIGKVYNFGDLLIEGIVMFHTKTDNFAGIELPSSLAFVEYQTITPLAAVQFPVYNPQSTTPGHSPDFKNLLYWNPSISLINNDTTITFYTADEISEYEIIVSGKTTNGLVVFGKYEIRVE